MTRVASALLALCVLSTFATAWSELPAWHEPIKNEYTLVREIKQDLWIARKTNELTETKVTLKASTAVDDLENECRDHILLCSAGTLCGKRFFKVSVSEPGSLIANMRRFLIGNKNAEWGLCELEGVVGTLEDTLWERNDEQNILISVRNVLLGMGNLNKFYRYHTNVTPSSLYIVHAPWGGSQIVKLGDFQHLKKRGDAQGDTSSFYSIPPKELSAFPQEEWGKILSKHSFAVTLMTWSQARGRQTHTPARIFAYRPESHGSPAMFMYRKIADDRVALVPDIAEPDDDAEPGSTAAEGTWDNLKGVIQRLLAINANYHDSSRSGSPYAEKYKIMDDIAAYVDGVLWERDVPMPGVKLQFEDLEGDDYWLIGETADGRKSTVSVTKGSVVSYSIAKDGQPSTKWYTIRGVGKTATSYTPSGNKSEFSVILVQNRGVVSSFMDVEGETPGMLMWYGSKHHILYSEEKAKFTAVEKDRLDKAKKEQERFCEYWEPLASEYCEISELKEELQSHCKKLKKCS